VSLTRAQRLYRRFTRTYAHQLLSRLVWALRGLPRAKGERLGSIGEGWRAGAFVEPWPNLYGMTDEEQAWAAEVVRDYEDERAAELAAEEDYGDGDEPECMDCGGEGYVAGYEIEQNYDAGWIDPEKTYRCPNCRGTGLRKDQTVF
jgi:hypothetical protein